MAAAGVSTLRRRRWLRVKRARGRYFFLAAFVAFLAGCFFTAALAFFLVPFFSAVAAGAAALAFLVLPKMPSQFWLNCGVAPLRTIGPPIGRTPETVWGCPN